MSAARAVIDAAGPLADTAPPRRARVATRRADASGSAARGRVERRDDGARRGAPAAARRPRVLLAGARPEHARDRAGGARQPRRGRGGADGRRRSSAARDAPAGPRDPRLERAGPAGARGRRRAARRRGDARREGAARGRPRRRASREVAAAGADERLATPFSPLQLQVKLRKLLGADAVAGMRSPRVAERSCPARTPGGWSRCRRSRPVRARARRRAATWSSATRARRAGTPSCGRQPGAACG